MKKRNSMYPLRAILYSFIFVLSILTIGCSGRDGAPLQTVSASQSPRINISSAQIAYGNVVLDNTLDQTLSIQNNGSSRLVLGEIALSKPLASPFSIINDQCSGRSLQASRSCTLQVRFAPTTEGSFADSFDIPSNDPAEKSVLVGVSGNGKAYRVVINQIKTDYCAASEIEMLVTVTDKNNAPLTGLGTENFQIFENGESKAVTGVFPVPAAQPISVAKVLDYSISMQNELSAIEAASISFIGLLNPEDEASIIKFAEKYQVMREFTTDANLLITSVNTAPSLIGSQTETHLYDTLWFAVEKTGERLNTKAIVLLSDGKDEGVNIQNVSVKTLPEVVAYAVEKEVAIFTIGLGKVDGAVMNQLADGTGGQYFYAPATDQLDAIYQAIRNLLEGWYSMKYATSVFGGSPITVDVAVDANGQGEGSRQATGCP